MLLVGNCDDVSNRSSWYTASCINWHR